MPERLYDIDSLLEEVVTLPSMPDSLARITKLLEDPHCDLKEVGRVMSTDPAIAMKTLRLVNSAYYGLGQEVTSVEHAVVLLGTRVIKNLVLTATVFNAIQGSPESYLNHCIACGVAMRCLAEYGKLLEEFDNANEAFVYGLLHEIGQIVISEYLPDAYRDVDRMVRDQGIPWHEAEQQVIGVDHAAVGARLAQKWRLTDSVTQALAGQYDLSLCDEDHRILAANVRLANYLTSAAGFASKPFAQVTMNAEFWEACGLPSSDVPRVCETYFNSLPDINELIALAG
jgi:HD-like signal output (HDOD) protein